MGCAFAGVKKLQACAQKRKNIFFKESQAAALAAQKVTSPKASVAGGCYGDSLGRR